METEVVEERTNFEASAPDDGDEIPETFPGHEALPSVSLRLMCARSFML